MKEFKNDKVQKFIVAHNNENVFHFVVAGPNAIVQTGQPYLEVFNSIAELRISFPNQAIHKSILTYLNTVELNNTNSTVE